MLFNSFNNKVVNNVNDNYIIKNIGPLSDYLDFKPQKLLYNDKNLIFFNMSLTAHEDVLWFAVRSGLKELRGDYWNENFVNNVFIGKIKGTVLQKKQINVEIDSLGNGRLGAEDPRIFEKDGRLFFSADIPMHFLRKKQLNAIFDINGSAVEIFNDPLNRHLSKNWMPYVEGNNVYLITDVLPTRILDCNTKKVSLYNNLNIPDVCGGGKIINIDGLKTSIVHGKIRGRVPPGLNYWHAIAQWDDKWNLRISEPFYFKKFGIEFSTGFEILKNNIYISYSVDDDGVDLFSVNLDQFMNSNIWRIDV
jgi:hypothetical protein